MKKLILLILGAFLLQVSPQLYAERIKDLTSIQGIRKNQLVGYGLVVGLNGTGDGTAFTTQSLKSMIKKFGVTLPAGTTVNAKNSAAVIIHADLPAFAKPGQMIDITVSSMGDSKSLRGGSLLMSPLKGADGKTYAMAQGNLIVGGLAADGADGSKITINVPSVGRIPDGATVERAVMSPFARIGPIVFNLHEPDFTTVDRMVKAINNAIGPGTAISVDAATVKVRSPRDLTQKVSFVSMLENILIEPAEVAARVIVNSRTGTVVISRKVRVTPAAVSHGNLTVTITEDADVSQPGPLAQAGTTATVPQTNIQVTEENQRMFVFKPGVSLNDIVRAVNDVGAGPSDLVAILEALKSAGALKAQLIVI
ncbi:MAG: flagellar basal body P-ring protein FlgI [Methylococcales bacterium]|jgi:flagellar P-ring protein FlgI|nr:flagellar basal body P-ring protein FlgI [Methylococcales bacterium]MBT7444506.1 flagellar basal body P-ring protein FlgI [Methylococcales bacterium]